MRNPTTMSQVVVILKIKSYQRDKTAWCSFYLVEQCWSCWEDLQGAEGFVHDHFCTGANFILQAFKANTDCSAAFGHYQDYVSHSFFEGSVKLHQKTKLYLELESAFTKNTASVTKLPFTDDTKNEALVLHTTNNEGLYQSKELWGHLVLFVCHCYFQYSWNL